MTTEYTGSGDPARTMALLWGTQQPPTRGPKPGLSVERIVRAAIEVADAEGLATLSMRRLAEHLGVGTMSLYTYLPGKAELVDVMVDTVHREPEPVPVPAAGDPAEWRPRLEAIARADWARFHRHPWLLQVAATTRPPLGPHLIAKYDRDLRAVEGIGLDDLEMDSVVSLVAGHVEGAARRSLDALQAPRQTGQTDQQWWEANAPLLEKVFDPSRFPTAARVGPAAGIAYQAAYDPEHAFVFGLERILDGIAALVRSRQEDVTEFGG
ncbi:MAG: Transcriptional regulator, AcrR family [uncultured Thermomicrobiales bacterium]|uniref:Transcriptional regulator, AcrR family n=1 Tax=uncultured Thermomicrobiales bacterium TaxID=1645740 RepID=A0A6J4V7L1_9BACT|nr:MAG: Transcriptional regulator, AcrR family [uncultured Thermomicrobiales bacterium]